MTNQNSIEKSKTTLFLIDDDCDDLDINNINKIICNSFNQTEFLVLNGQLIAKNVFVNYLPVATSSSYLNLSDLNWSEVTSYSSVIFLTGKSEPIKEIKIIALFYRILTGKSMIAFKNGEWYGIDSFISFYPHFLNVYAVENRKSYELPEIKPISSEEMSSFKENLKNELERKVFTASSRISFNSEVDISLNDFNSLFTYVLNNGKDWKRLLDDERFANHNAKDYIERLTSKLETYFINESEFKFYDAQYSLHKSLANDLQVTLPKSDENTVYVYKTNAADFNFRNLKFKNILINIPNEEPKFVVPFYKDEQATRQTVRFLVMMLYKVYNNSILVDMIVLYLFMRVSLVQDKLIKTRFENIARLFLKRHGAKLSQINFLRVNRKSILALKQHFKELANFEDDDELFELFEDFVTNDFKLGKNDFIKPFEIAYYEQELEDLKENQLDVLPQLHVSKCQEKAFEIDDSNWPTNFNFKCDDSKLQFNSSLPFFICIRSYQEFLDRIEQISWMKTIAKLTDKLVLKGGAILDLLSDRVPKDYDLMNTCMTNEELLDFLHKFSKQVKPKSIEFFKFPLSIFRIRLENDDLLGVYF